MLALPVLSYLHTGERLVLDDYDVEHDDCTPVDPEDLDEAKLSQHLYTYGVPDPDLIVRTAGEMRLSNFLLWQGAYAEHYVTDACWPDFGRGEAIRALEAYRGRRRSFGGVLPNSAD